MNITLWSLISKWIMFEQPSALHSSEKEYCLFYAMYFSRLAIVSKRYISTHCKYLVLYNVISNNIFKDKIYLSTSSIKLVDSPTVNVISVMSAWETSWFSDENKYSCWPLHYYLLLACCIKLSWFELMPHEAETKITSVFNVTFCALLLHTVPSMHNTLLCLNPLHVQHPA